MSTRGPRLSRPLYEALPWIYIACGLAALVASYFHPAHLPSLFLGIPGLIGVLAGIVVVLRRRDFRQLKANNYIGEESPELRNKDE